MVYDRRKEKRAGKIVIGRCENSVARILDFCEANPRPNVRWKSLESAWSSRVTLLDRKRLVDGVVEESDGLEEFLEHDDRTYRKGVDHVILPVLVPLAKDVALGDALNRIAEQFLSDMERTSPVLEDASVDV